MLDAYSSTKYHLMSMNNSGFQQVWEFEIQYQFQTVLDLLPAKI